MEENLKEREEEKQKEENTKKREEEFKQIKEKPKKIKKEKDKMKEKKKKRKWIPITILIILIMGIIISTIFAFANINKETIASGVKIEGIDVSGLSADEAKGKLETIYKEKLETEIPVQYNEYESTINANLFETQYNIEKAVKQATNIGKGGNIFENNYNILFALIGKKI